MLSLWNENNHLLTDQNPVVKVVRLDYHTPEHVRKVLAEVALDDDPYLHQYSAGIGHPRLMQNVSKLYSPLIGRQIEPSKGILITSGANEAIHTATFGFVDKGDEVIVIEPFYNSYVPIIESVGGIPRLVPLRLKTSITGDITSADWTIDHNELASAFNSRTKMIFLNNPHYPLGKVFSREELGGIADLCTRHNVLCLSDEALEWTVYEPAKHVRIATLPGMWERTITVCSAGKTLLAPGWKVGWAYGPEALIRNMKVAYQNSCCTPLQEAVSRLLHYEMSRHSSPDCYFSSMRLELILKRHCLIDVLRERGLRLTVPDAGHFIVVEL